MRQTMLGLFDHQLRLDARQLVGRAHIPQPGGLAVECLAGNCLHDLIVGPQAVRFVIAGLPGQDLAHQFLHQPSNCLASSSGSSTLAGRPRWSLEKLWSMGSLRVALEMPPIELVASWLTSAP